MKFIELTVWGENWCDDYFDISNSNGFSFYTLEDIKKQLEEEPEVFKEYQESTIKLKMTHIPAQIGNYPPPNVEVGEYWDWEVIKVTKFETGERANETDTVENLIF